MHRESESDENPLTVAFASELRRGMKWHMRGLGEDGGLGLDVCQVKRLAPHHRAVTQLVLRLAVGQGTAQSEGSQQIRDRTGDKEEEQGDQVFWAQ